MMAIWSRPTVITRSPSGKTWAAKTKLVCPRSSLASPAEVSHTVAKVSRSQVRMRSPTGNTASSGSKKLKRGTSSSGAPKRLSNVPVETSQT